MADQIHAIGRRKEAVCRVYLTPGSGKWEINGASSATTSRAPRS
jgi:small subunit ribosomal protein S9